VDWLLAPDGTVASTQSSGIFTRPHPLSDGPIGGTPEPLLTTEILDLECSATASSSGTHIDWSRLDFHYANGNESILGAGFASDKIVATPPGTTVLDTMSGAFTADGSSIPFLSTTTTTAIPGEKLVHVASSAQVYDLVLLTMDMTFDPPLNEESIWEKLRAGVRWTAKATGTVVMYGLGGIGCIGTTVGGCALGGVTSVASLGTAAPAGLAVAAGGATACAGLAAGAGFVVGEIWEQ
jgi:hypothetical protein